MKLTNGGSNVDKTKFPSEFKDELDDLLRRSEILLGIEELREGLPRMDLQTLKIVLAASSALIDTINEAEEKPK